MKWFHSFFYYFAHLLPVLVIIIHMYNPNQFFFAPEHKAFAFSPQPFKFLAPILLDFFLVFSLCWPALMTFPRVHYDFLVHPHPLWVIWPLLRFPVQFAFVPLHFFQFDSLCNSPSFVLFPSESMFLRFFAPCPLKYLILMWLLPTVIGQEKHVAVCDWSESVVLLFSAYNFCRF